MARESTQPLPQRKEPGLISKFFSRIIGIIFWLFVSLIVSIVFEWIGIAFVWPEKGANHSKLMLEKEYGYLNQRLANETQTLSLTIYKKTHSINQWLVQESGIISLINSIASPAKADTGKFKRWLNKKYQHYQHYQDYIIAIPYTAQVFVVRIAVILFSLPVFLLFGLVGAADGLVERDLRRWGGGRESSNVYNLARKSIFPVFILACVLYISLPVSIQPAWVIMPFSVVFGLSVRVSFERLKKYF